MILQEKETTRRWERRFTEMTQKHKAVDVAEYNRVVAALAEAEQAAATSKAEADGLQRRLDEATERLGSLESELRLQIAAVNDLKAAAAAAEAGQAAAVEAATESIQAELAAAKVAVAEGKEALRAELDTRKQLLVVHNKLKAPLLKAAGKLSNAPNWIKGVLDILGGKTPAEFVAAIKAEAAEHQAQIQALQVRTCMKSPRYSDSVLLTGKLHAGTVWLHW